MANQQPTVRSLDRRMGGVEQQLGEVAESLDRVQHSISELHDGNRAQSERLLSVIGNLRGLDEIGTGLASIAEVLAPVRQFAPPSTARELDRGIPEALGRIRAALGGEDRELNFTILPTTWDGAVGFIGQPVRDSGTKPQESAR